MTRFFNTAGPCNPDDHYMLPPERRLPGVRDLVDEKLYFVVQAPRQVGKTTCFRTLAQSLTRGGDYVAVHSSRETGQAAGGNVERGVNAVIASLHKHAYDQLPESLRPPDANSEVEAEFRLSDLLTRWCRDASRPVVWFVDEVDALYDETLISVLRQLRDGYATRPDSFPQSVALIGLRDVRDYKIRGREHEDRDTLGTSSPFNIKVESITIRDFTADEVVELYQQHTDKTGQLFTDDAMALAFELTQGQPWLVNALAREITHKLVRERTVTVTAAHIEAAKERLIERRDTHLDSLIDRLRETRVRRVIEPILVGDLVVGDRIDDDIAFAEDSAS